MVRKSGGQRIYPQQTIITQQLTDRLHTKEGDTIRVRNDDDLAGYTFTVDRVANSSAGEFLSLPLDELDRMVGLPAGSYVGIWSDEEVMMSGYLPGISLLVISMSALMQVLTKSMQLTIPVRLDVRYILFGFVVVMVTYLAARLMNQKKIDRIPMSEALMPARNKTLSGFVTPAEESGRKTRRETTCLRLISGPTEMKRSYVLSYN